MSERVAIVGSRAERVDGRLTEGCWRRRAMVFDYVEALAFESKETVIVTGGADGVDQWAEDAARKYGLRVEVIEPDWKKYGRRAGMIRNQEIVVACTRLVAFWDGTSKGALDSIEKARKVGKSVEVYT